MHLGHRDLAARIGDAGLLVRLACRRLHLTERGVVVGAVERTGGRARGEAERLDVQRVVAVLVRVLGPHQHRGGRAVAHARAVEDAQRPGDQRRAGDGLLGHFLAELRPRVQRAVAVVLPRNAGEDLLHGVLVEPVLVGVGRCQQAERGRCRDGGVGAVAGRAGAGETRVARVLQLLHADGHHHVVGARRHCVGSVAECLRAGGAHVLEPGDRLVVELQRLGQRQARDARAHRAEPEGVNVVLFDARRCVRLVCGVGEHVIDAAVPVLAELGATHSDDRDLVANAM